MHELLIKEIKVEQQISPFLPDEPLSIFVNEGMYFINGVCGTEIDYDTDLDARSLLKTYVMYANHKIIAEFKEVYQHAYIQLQIKYFKNPDLS